MNFLTDKVIHTHRWLAGKLVVNDIPERLRNHIVNHQIESERIIGWAQLVIVSAFAVL